MAYQADNPRGLDLEQATKLAQSDAGQALLSELQTRHGNALQAAMEQAQAGNYDQVKRTLSSLLNTPEGKALLNQLRGQRNG